MRAARPSGFSRRLDCASRPSADLAGRSVALSLDIPPGFDAPLAAHHKAIGRWAAQFESSPARYSRPEARARIERVFNAAVLEILAPIELADLRVVALIGGEGLPPALGIICDSIGQIDLGWIEKDNVLSNTLFGNVAPLGWRAAAYKALTETLHTALPVFGYDDLFYEISMYYWEGETDDIAASRALIEYHCGEDDALDEEMLPSAINARRPDWMLAKNADPLKRLPPGLRAALARVRAAQKALKAIKSDANAWHFDFDLIAAYMPHLEDCSPLPIMTLVPFEHFARELDDVGRHGMESSFMDVAGLCLLGEGATVEAWFASLKIGAEFLLAAQHLINLDPANLRQQ
jgi:hypothetical protein